MVNLEMLKHMVKTYQNYLSFFLENQKNALSFGTEMLQH